jgi:hypothetical protein
MPFSGMLRRVAFVITDVSEECSASIKYYIVLLPSVLRLLVTANVVPSSLILFTSMMETRSSETSVRTRVICLL